MADETFTSADFHNVVQKQIVNAVFETMAAGKLDWEVIEPFLDVARRICRSEFQEAAQIRFHSLRAEGDQWVHAEEAFLGISVADRDNGEEWLSETWWVSDIARADGDLDQVRLTVAALERSLAKLHAWIAEKEASASPEELPADLPEQEKGGSGESA
ncbi:MAG TPA: hypothetical protein VGX37_00320 [Allosphingosinicella sp.]|nr:hypothetical protein [Allosphingosinicella sp.]